jgi:hypothetical protein
MLWLLAVLTSVVAAIASPQLVEAGPIKVGNGTAASCTEFALRAALVVASADRGGTIRFKCGNSPAIIGIRERLTIPDNTTIDGNGLITLDGGHVTDLVRVDAASTVALIDVCINNRRGGFVRIPCGYATTREP